MLQEKITDITNHEAPFLKRKVLKRREELLLVDDSLVNGTSNSLCN
jgi:hypothetical protein